VELILRPSNRDSKPHNRQEFLRKQHTEHHSGYSLLKSINRFEPRMAKGTDGRHMQPNPKFASKPLEPLGGGAFGPGRPLKASMWLAAPCRPPELPLLIAYVQIHVREHLTCISDASTHNNNVSDTIHDTQPPATPPILPGQSAITYLPPIQTSSRGEFSTVFHHSPCDVRADAGALSTLSSFLPGAETHAFNSLISKRRFTSNSPGGGRSWIPRDLTGR